MFFVMLCFFCNNGIFRNAVCDAPLDEYCEAFWETQTDICNPGVANTGQCDLQPNQCFFNWVYVTLAFTVLDLILVRFLAKTNVVVRNDFNPYLYESNLADYDLMDGGLLDDDFSLDDEFNDDFDDEFNEDFDEDFDDEIDDDFDDGLDEGDLI